MSLFFLALLCAFYDACISKPPERSNNQGNYMRKGKMPNGQKEPESNKPTTQSLATWIAIGVAIGAGIGVALDNLAMGVAIGIAIGAAIGAAQNQKNKNR
jgi:hypothetical protein